MPHARGTLRVSALIGLWLLALAPASARDAAIVPVKLGFGAMTEAQTKELWEKVETYAQFDALLADCGKPSNIEKRMLAVVQSCVEPGALQKVVAKFRSTKARHARGPSTVGFCDGPIMEAHMKQLHALIDSVVEEAASACSNCFFC